MTDMDRAAALAPAIGLVAALHGGCGGCGGDEVTPFVSGVDPLEAENHAPLPAPTATDPFPELLVSVHGEAGGYVWAHARGYVHAAPADVRAAMTAPAVCVDRRRAATWSVMEDVEPEYDVSFRIHMVVEDIITVEFDVTWRHDTLAAGDGGAELFASRWKKTDGTSFISRLEGSVLLLPASPDQPVTEVQLIEHLDAAGGGWEEIDQFLHDFYASILAQVRGEPLPTY